MNEGYIFVSNNVFPTLLAISEDEQSRGLMWQEAPTPVMSFIYATPKINRFWMLNTPAPLDIVFCCKGEILQICKGEPYSTEAIGSMQFSDLVIEFPFGTVESSNIKIGNKVGLIKPTIAELNKIISKKARVF